MEIGGGLAGLQLGHFGGVGAGDGVELKGETVGGELGEGGGELVNGVVGTGERTVAAAIGGGKAEVGVDFFGGLDVGFHGLAVIEIDAAGVGVDDECGVDEVAVIFDEPVRAVEVAALFIGGEGEDEVTLGLVAFAVQAQEGRDEGGVGVFHVLGAAAVVVAVLLVELEGVRVPVGGEGLDDVHVAEEEDGFGAGAAGDADDEVHFAGVGAEEMDVRGGETGVEEALLHGRGGGGDVAFCRVGGVDFDELAEDVFGEGAVFRRGGGDGLCEGGWGSGEEQDENENGSGEGVEGGDAHGRDCTARGMRFTRGEVRGKLLKRFIQGESRSEGTCRRWAGGANVAAGLLGRILLCVYRLLEFCVRFACWE